VSGVTASSAFETDSKTPVGGTVGGGVEYAFTNNVSVGVEYRYSDFGHETFNAGVVRLAGLGTGPLTTTRVELRTHEVTVRLNFKLGTLFAP
jgi:outer membrane immunogenic protein